MKKLWEEYLFEKEVKIHPKRKTAMSYASVGNPADDVVFAGLGLGAIGNKVSGSLMKRGVSTKAASIAGKGTGIAVGVAAGIAAVEGYRLIRSFFDKCTKQCGTFKVNTSVRQLCMLNCKKSALQKQVVLLRKHNKIKESNKTNDKLKIIDKKIVLYKQYLKNKKEKVKK